MLTKGYRVQTSLRALPLEEEISMSDEDFEMNMKAIDALEALDDVDSVEHNIKMTDD
jgi:transcriptional/translational regulatory protein YebC/TACO1